jgi:class 3 adenylate cyclase
MTRVRYARTEDGANIAYVVYGSGPPLLFARPLLRAAVDEDLEAQFDPMLPLLAESRSIVFWDYRGSGMSDGVPPQYTLDSAVLDMRAVADALGAERYDLLAQLTPCETAIAFAAAQPERVRRIVLRNPSARGSPRITTLGDLPDISASHFAHYMQLAALRIFGWDLARAAKRWERDMLRRFDARSWHRLMDEMEAVDAGPLVSSVRAPTLIVVDNTAYDRATVIPPARQQYMRGLAARVPNAELAVVKSSSGPKEFVRVVEDFLGRDDDAPAAALPHGTAIVLFTDIADSTAITERMGDAGFRAAARALDERMRAAMRECSGTPVEGKVLGDGVMAVFSSAAQAIDAARRCVALSAESELRLHIGLHAGDVIREDNNVYGGAVNIAARICGLSQPGEILVSGTIRELARTSASAGFEDRGEQALKGIEEPVRVFAVR